MLIPSFLWWIVMRNLQYDWIKPLISRLFKVTFLPCIPCHSAAGTDPDICSSFFICLFKHPFHLICPLEMSWSYCIHRLYFLLITALIHATTFSHINHRHTLLADFFIFLSSTLIFFLKMCREMLCRICEAEIRPMVVQGDPFWWHCLLFCSVLAHAHAEEWKNLIEVCGAQQRACDWCVKLELTRGWGKIGKGQRFKDWGVEPSSV